jgi:hypothetical protein
VEDLGNSVMRGVRASLDLVPAEQPELPDDEGLPRCLPPPLQVWLKQRPQKFDLSSRKRWRVIDDGLAQPGDVSAP